MKDFLLLIVLVLLLQILYKKKEHMQNISNKHLVNNLNNNKIIKEIEQIKEDKIEINTNKEENVFKYPENSNNFITIPSVTEAIYGSSYIDEAHGLLLGYLNQEISNDELKRISGNVKTLNTKNTNKFFNPTYYRFDQPYFDFQNLNNYEYTPNYKIEKNYLKN